MKTSLFTKWDLNRACHMANWDWPFLLLGFVHFNLRSTFGKSIACRLKICGRNGVCEHSSWGVSLGILKWHFKVGKYTAVDCGGSLCSLPVFFWHTYTVYVTTYLFEDYTLVSSIKFEVKTMVRERTCIFTAFEMYSSQIDCVNFLLHLQL